MMGLNIDNYIHSCKTDELHVASPRQKVKYVSAFAEYMYVW